MAPPPGATVRSTFSGMGQPGATGCCNEGFLFEKMVYFGGCGMFRCADTAKRSLRQVGELSRVKQMGMPDLVLSFLLEAWGSQGRQGVATQATSSS